MHHRDDEGIRGAVVKMPVWLPAVVVGLSVGVCTYLILPVPRPPSTDSPRLLAIEKRLLDLEVSTREISFRMRLERRVNDEESQRRVDEIVARANAARDAARDAGRDR